MVLGAERARADDRATGAPGALVGLSVGNERFRARIERRAGRALKLGKHSEATN